MFESSIRRGVVATGLALAVGVSGCAAGETPQPTGTGPAASDPVSTPTVGVSPSPNPSRSPSGGVLVVLAEGPDGVRGLWTLDANSKWSPVAKTPEATALGRAADGVALANATGIEVRRAAELATALGVTALKWATAPLAIADVDVSAAGKIALVAAEGSTLRYATAGTDGTLAVLTYAPTQSFTPLIAWVGDSSLLVLSTDEQQNSRLAVVDAATRTMTAVEALSGVRVFAASSNGKVIAAASASSIYVAQLTALVAGPAPAPIAGLAEGQVVWAMAMDRTGERLWTLSGQVGSDGSVGSVRELGYAAGASGWAKWLDVAVPFGRGLDQVFLPWNRLIGACREPSGAPVLRCAPLGRLAQLVRAHA